MLGEAAVTMVFNRFEETEKSHVILLTVVMEHGSVLVCCIPLRANWSLYTSRFRTVYIFYFSGLFAISSVYLFLLAYRCSHSSFWFLARQFPCPRISFTFDRKRRKTSQR